MYHKQHKENVLKWRVKLKLERRLIKNDRARTKANCGAAACLCFCFTVTLSVKRGLTLVQGPQAEVGLPVELFHTCWPRGGVENVPLLVPGSLVMCCQLTLHIQVRHRCQRETHQVRRQLTTCAKVMDPIMVTRNMKTVKTFNKHCCNVSHQHPRRVFTWTLELFSRSFNRSVTTVNN